MSSGEHKDCLNTAYKVFSYEWQQEHKDSLPNLHFIEMIRRIAADWALLTPADKLIYWEKAGAPKTMSQVNKKKKVSVQRNDDEYDFVKTSKKKSRSFSNLSGATEDDSSDSDVFIQQKRKYRKKDKSLKNGDSDRRDNASKRRYTKRDPDFVD